jgi:RNA polymerase sigma factor (sigma-70 family)
VVDAHDAHDVGDTTGPPRPSDPIPDPPPAAEIEEFFRRYWAGLVRHLMRDGANRWEAQDAVSEAIREALRRWRDLTHPVAWVRTAARSHWLKQRKASGQGDVEVLVPDVAELSEGRADDPQLQAYELEEWFSGVLAQLPPARREALELSAQGLTPSEIAAQVGKTPEAVRTALKLGRKQAVALWRAIPEQRTSRPVTEPLAGPVSEPLARPVTEAEGGTDG